MAVWFISNDSTFPEVEGSFYYCLEHADNGDTISIDPDAFGDFFPVIPVPDTGITINKSIIINPDNGRRIHFETTSGAPTDRFLKIVGTSANRVNVVINDCWLRGWRATHFNYGNVFCNYAEAHFNRCGFADLSCDSSSKCVYAANSEATFYACIFHVNDGYCVNYASTATVNLLNCTCIGNVKQGGTIVDCALMSAQWAVEELCNPDLFCYSPKSSSTFATGRTAAIDNDFYNNPIEVGGAVGALAVCAPSTTLAAYYRPNDRAVVFSSDDPHNLLVVNGEKAVAFTTSAGYIEEFERTTPFEIYVEAADNFAVITVDIEPDMNWYRACFSSIGVPVQTADEMAAIMPHYKQIFRH